MLTDSHILGIILNNTKSLLNVFSEISCECQCSFVLGCRDFCSCLFFFSLPLFFFFFPLNHSSLLVLLNNWGLASMLTRFLRLQGREQLALWCKSSTLLTWLAFSMSHWVTFHHKVFYYYFFPHWSDLLIDPPPTCQSPDSDKISPGYL